MRRRLLILTAAAAGLAAVLLPGTPAGAHPLGNFSINSYVGLTIHSDHIDATAIVDIAEIPTLQDRPDVDRDGDGSVSIVERSDFSRRTCATVARDVTLTRDTNRLEWTVVRSAFDYAPGAGGLDVSRLTCDLTVPTTVDTPTTLAVDNTYLSDRIGWRELTAAGDGVRLIGSPVPATSISHELRDYPKDLLSSTLDVRAATLRVEPGAGASAATGALPAGLGTGGDPVSR